MALTDKQAKALQHGDKPVFDGRVTGLMLTPGKTGSKWTLRFTRPITGKRRDAGLGVNPEVSIADARDKAFAMRRQIDAGKDPIEERDREQQAASNAAVLTNISLKRAYPMGRVLLIPPARFEFFINLARGSLEGISQDRRQTARHDHARRLRQRVAPDLA